MIMKLLAALRLSRTGDTSTSIETQRTGVESWVQANGHEVVHWSTDLDVSGGMAIRDRPDVGPWLQDDHLDLWDGLVGYSLSRLFRDQLDFLLFYRDICQGKGKIIIVVDDDIDSSTPRGKRELNRQAEWAEEERARMSARRRDAATRIRSAGRWGGGQVPWGYRPKEVNGGWELEPDPELADTIREVATMVIDGGSLSAAARWLTDHEVVTPRESNRNRAKRQDPYQWWPATIRDCLRSRSLLGEQSHDGAPVRGSDGLPVRYRPILTGDTWDDLQAALDALSRPLGTDRRNAAPLTHIVFCTCTGHPPLWRTSGSGYHYYRCASQPRGHPCGQPMIRADLLEPTVDEAILEVLGPIMITETTTIPGDDHSQAKAEVGRAIRDLMDERYVRGVVRQDHESVLAGLQAEHDRLSLLPAEPARVIERPTGVFIREVWPDLDADGRRAFLRKRGTKVYAALTHGPDRAPTTHINGRLVVMIKHGLLVMVDLGTKDVDTNAFAAAVKAAEA